MCNEYKGEITCPRSRLQLHTRDCRFEPLPQGDEGYVAALSAPGHTGVQYQSAAIRLARLKQNGFDWF